MKLSKSLLMQDRSKAVIPGMSQLLSKRPDRFSQGIWPGYYSKAKGAEVWDLDGNRYLDMSIGGIGATVLGYADPDVDAAVIEAIRSGCASSLNCPEEVELAELLCTIHPWAEQVRYTRSGGEAMAVAVRIARAKTGRDKVAFCGYHGWHDWYLAANLSEDDALDGHLMAGLPPRGVPRALRDTAFPFHYNRLDELKDIIEKNGRDLAIIVMESIRNSTPEPGFLEGVRALADECGAVLVVDEISAGLRMNTGGAHLLYGLTPDIAVFSKALGNGYPIAAIIGKVAVMSAIEETFVSSTCWTERTGPTAALATLKKHAACNVGEHLTRLGEKVQEGWAVIAERQGVNIHVGGLKAMSHFAFLDVQAPLLKAYFIQLLMEQGILGGTLCYLMYAHAEDDVERYLAACDAAFAGVREALTKGTLASKCKGKPSMAGFVRLA